MPEEMKRNIVLMGAPGSGKGTQGAILSEKLGIKAFSMGDILRNVATGETKEAKKVKALIDKGNMVPDKLAIRLMEQELFKPENQKGFILDGFPRTIIQARELDSIGKEFGFKIDAIINLDIPQEKLVKRLSGRRTCKNCGATFHVEFNPSKVEGVCDKCGGELYQRPDESEEAVKVRLSTYNKQTKPLIDYYTMKGTIININGDQPMEDVFKDIEKALEDK